MMKLIIISFLLPISLSAQMPAWSVVTLDPTIDVEHMELDSLGFLWFNDAHTLYRFDGAEATSKFELTKEEITSFSYHSDRFLLGTSLGRVLSLDPYSLIIKVLQDTIKNEVVTDILYFDDRNYVIVAYGSGLRIMHNGINRKISIENGLVSNEVYDIAYFNDKYYLATDQGIQILDPLIEESLINIIGIEDGLSDLVVTHLITFANRLWYTDYDGHLGSIDKQHHIENHGFNKRSKVNTLLANKRAVYIATDDGLSSFGNGKFYSQYPVEGSQKVKMVQKDEEGNLWLITSDGILLKGNLYFQKINAEFDDVRAFTKIGNSFVIGSQKGLYAYNNNTTKKLNNKNITHLITADNYLLVGTFSEGVMVYDSNFNLIDQIEEWQGHNGQSVLHIYYDGKILYVSSLTGVMEFSFEKGHLSPIKTLNNVIGPGYIYSIISANDKMYFGTDRKGLIVWDKKSNEVISHKAFIGGEKIGSVFSITQDIAGSIWFASDERGLGFLEKSSATILRNQINVSDHYTSLVTVNNGSLLAIRGSTVDLIDPISHHIMYFDKELGIKKENSYLNTIYRENDITYFVHNHNIYAYIPDLSIKIHPEVIIDEVLVNLSPVFNQSDFSEDENNIEFKYSGSWLTDPTKLTYQCMLEGFDEDWRVTKDNTISFRKLPPGQYRFRVRASENGQFNDEPEDTYTFEIKRHFYNHKWVKALGLLLMALLGWQIIKSREARKKEKLTLEKLNIENQFINLKNQLNPHFLFNAFNTLIGMIEEDSDRSVAFVERMTDFYRNMLEYGKYNLITLGQEKEMLSQYIDILKARFNGQLEIKLEINDKLESYELPPMTLQLLLENAVKHNEVSTKKPLQVSIKQVKNKITILNNKAALVHEAKSTKTGLDNIKRRFELINMKAPEINDLSEVFEVIVYLKRKEI